MEVSHRNNGVTLRLNPYFGALLGSLGDWDWTGEMRALTCRFAVYPLPSRGALIRHIAIDPRTHDVWLAYGASPGIPARIARLSLRR